MATTRGFVERLEIGRGGLVTATLVEADASRSTFVVSDIDGDPERFNERLTKVAVLRDAMNRAEPVEVEHVKGAAGEEIARVARISRDDLDPPGDVEQTSGLVVQVVVQSTNALQGSGEAHDEASVAVLGLDGGLDLLRLDLQAPERAVAVAQLDVVRDAQARGVLCRFLVTTHGEKTGRQIIAVAESDLGADDGGEPATVVAGFVESLGVVLPAASGVGSALALARITTAPELNGPGGTVDPTPFAPTVLAAYVARGSVTYQLLEAGLRDNVRMRVAYLELTGKGGDGGEVGFRTAADAPALAVRYGSFLEAGSKDGGEPTATRALLLAAELLAPLASASRPVWVRIDRDMLDRGPDAACTPGLPSTDLGTRSLRDLRIPYLAQWLGHGCFNHGVYRFQLAAPDGTTVHVDDADVCLYDTGVAGTHVGYACLEGDHTVTVEIPAYTCDTDFDLDVYRVR